MPEKILILLVLVLSASFSFAGDANTCDLKASLRPGPVERFWNFGTDSWAGDGQIVCRKVDEIEGRKQNRRSSPRAPADFLYRNINFRFESWIPGYGPLAGSSFDVSISDIPLNSVPEIFGSFRSYRSSAPTLTDSVVLFAKSEITQLVMIFKKTGRWDESYSKSIGIGQIIITQKPDGATR